ncbi:phospholipase A2 inhibitor gamma subunit B-like [Podarcis muralis]
MVIFLTVNVDAIFHGMSNFVVPLNVSSSLLTEVANLICSNLDNYEIFCVIDDGFCFNRDVSGYLNGSIIYGIADMGCVTTCSSENYSFTTLQGYLESEINCCQDDFCNYKYIYGPLHVFNGRKCEACHASVSEGCSDLKTVGCRDAETQCISFVIVHNDSSAPDEIYKGCASPSLCDMARKSLYNEYFSGTMTEARCYDTLPSSEQLNFEG